MNIWIKVVGMIVAGMLVINCGEEVNPPVEEASMQELLLIEASPNKKYVETIMDAAKAWEVNLNVVPVVEVKDEMKFRIYLVNEDCSGSLELLKQKLDYALCLGGAYKNKYGWVGFTTSLPNSNLNITMSYIFINIENINNHSFIGQLSDPNTEIKFDNILTFVIVHEFGHVLGIMPHSNNTKDVMFKELHLRMLQKPSNNELAIIKNIYPNGVKGSFEAMMSEPTVEKYHKTIPTFHLVMY